MKLGLETASPLPTWLCGFVRVRRTSPRGGSPGLLYAVLSLTLARQVPVALALLRSGLDAREMLFLSWIGPRGPAWIQVEPAIRACQPKRQVLGTTSRPPSRNVIPRVRRIGPGSVGAVHTGAVRRAPWP